MKLLKVDSLAQAREKLLSHITWNLGKTEEIALEKSAGRVWPAMYVPKSLCRLFAGPR